MNRWGFKKNKEQKKMYHLMREHYGTHYESAVIEEQAILYETRDGASITDSPYAIFLNLITQEKYQNYQHIWVLKSGCEEALFNVPEAYRKFITVVERDTLDYVEAMLTSKYLITNSTFQTFFVKRPEQIYINTWHGTPLKLMGLDMPGGLYGAQNVMRNFLMSDFIVSPNAHTTNIFKHAYKLNNVYTGKIIEHGYPRIDLTFKTTKQELFEKLAQFGVSVDESKEILLYTPTWRGTSVSKADNTIEQTVKEIEQLKETLADRYHILIKAHPFAYSYLKEDERLAGLLVSDYIDANELLSVTDVLVTDYSSIFFDFLVTDKPIVFYVWDKEVYENQRGLYIDQSELPGPTAESLEDLVEVLQDVEINTQPYQLNYQALKEKMVPYDDGNVTQDYVDIMFNHDNQPSVKLVSLDSDKIKLLFYPGGMRKNGITTSFLNLMDNIDYDRYDVTLLAEEPKIEEVRYNYDRLNKHVRCLYRTGGTIWSPEEIEANRQLFNRDFSSEEAAYYPEQAYRRDTNRLLGNMRFDTAIDFSGYSLYWAKNILEATANRYLIFAHNDLYADAHRTVDDKMPMYNGLMNLFSFYHKFDKIISVSPMTMEVNREKLAKFIRDDQMTYSVNTINIQAILANQPEEEVALAENPYNIQINKQEKSLKQEGKVSYFKNFEALKQNEASFVELSKEASIMSLSSAVVEGVVYDKVIVDNVVLGWIDNDWLINESPTYIESIEDYYAVGTVTRNLNFSIWKEIRMGRGADEKVAYLRDFKNTYLTISKLAKTSKGRYVLVSYLGEELGWMSPRPLTNIHQLSKWSPLPIYFNTRTKRLNETLNIRYSKKIEEFNHLVRVKETITNLKLYNFPKGVTNSRLSNYNSARFIEVLLTAYEKVTTDEGIFIGVKFENSKIGYIEEKDLVVIDSTDVVDNDSLKTNVNNNLSDLNEQEISSYQLPANDLVGSKVLPIESDYFNFVNMGRLSPEKNQVALIHGFAKFNQENPQTRLYILGKGPLEQELIQAVKETNMTKNVFVLGHMDKPFKFVEQNNAFVLPSFYEGQPMVLLESMTLGLPILASDIPANRNVVGDEEYGLYITGFEADDIAKGLSRLYNHQVPFKEFDYEAYNQQAINNFYQHLSDK